MKYINLFFMVFSLEVIAESSEERCLNFVGVGNNFQIAHENSDCVSAAKLGSGSAMYSIGLGYGFAGKHNLEKAYYILAAASLITASSVDRLLLMLEKKRFQCLPLSVLEIDQILEQAKANNQDLAIVPNLYIFYPNPVFINITKQPKHISYRVIYGVSRLFETGKAETIFYDNFAQAVHYTLPANAHIFLLNNHLLTQSDASRIESYFYAHYLQSKSLTIHKALP